MKKTSLYDIHLKLNAKMTSFSGYDMPLIYSSIINEHQAVRNNVGLFDVSHMGNIILSGKEAMSFINHLTTNKISKERKVKYSLFLNRKGKILDDVLIYALSETIIMIVSNASNTSKIHNWIVKNKRNFDITIIDLSEKISQISIQGKESERVLQKIIDFDLKKLNFMDFNVLNLESFFVVSRSGYTGEDGFEIYGLNAKIKEIFENLLSLNVMPIGLGARDTLRFEASLPLYGNEISESISPLEAGLSFALKNENYIGKSKIQKEIGNLKKKLVGIKMLEKGIPRKNYRILKDGDSIGYITTGYKLPNHSQGLAMAYINSDYSKIGTKLSVEIRNNLFDCVITKKIFMKKKYKKE